MPNQAGGLIWASNAPTGPEHEKIVVEVAVKKYLEGRIGVRILYAVSKLLYFDFFDVDKEFFQGNNKKYKSFRRYARTRDLRAPLYTWQAPLYWNDVTTKINCLKTVDYYYWLEFLPLVCKDPLMEEREEIREVYLEMSKKLRRLKYKKPVVVYSLS